MNDAIKVREATTSLEKAAAIARQLYNAFIEALEARAKANEAQKALEVAKAALVAKNAELAEIRNTVIQKASEAEEKRIIVAEATDLQERADAVKGMITALEEAANATKAFIVTTNEANKAKEDATIAEQAHIDATNEADEKENIANEMAKTVDEISAIAVKNFLAIFGEEPIIAKEPPTVDVHDTTEKKEINNKLDQISFFETNNNENKKPKEIVSDASKDEDKDYQKNLDEWLLNDTNCPPERNINDVATLCADSHEIASHDSSKTNNVNQFSDDSVEENNELSKSTSPNDKTPDDISVTNPSLYSILGDDGYGNYDEDEDEEEGGYNPFGESGISPELEALSKILKDVDDQNSKLGDDKDKGIVIETPVNKDDGPAITSVNSSKSTIYNPALLTDEEADLKLSKETGVTEGFPDWLLNNDDGEDKPNENKTDDKETEKEKAEPEAEEPKAETVVQPQQDNPPVASVISPIQIEGTIQGIKKEVPVEVEIPQNEAPVENHEDDDKSEKAILAALVNEAINTDWEKTLKEKEKQRIARLPAEILANIIYCNAQEKSQTNKVFVSTAMLRSKTAKALVGRALKHFDKNAKTWVEEKFTEQEERDIEEMMGKVIELGELHFIKKGTGYLIPVQTLVKYGRDTYSALCYVDYVHKDSKHTYTINMDTKEVIEHNPETNEDTTYDNLCDNKDLIESINKFCRLDSFTSDNGTIRNATNLSGFSFR